MTATSFNTGHSGARTAPLRNVQLFSELVDRVKTTPQHLPNWAAFYGVSGVGKTTAASHAALTHNAVYLECGSTWSTSTLVESIAHELSMPPMKGSVSKKVIEIIRVLADDPVPMIFDEADHLIKKSLVDVVREIADKSKAPIIFIGEQHLPAKIMQFERAHNRVQMWVESQPCDINDARQLLKMYGGPVAITDDLLRKIVGDTDGSTRRIVTNLHRVREFAKTRGLDTVDLKTYSDEIYRGLPSRRVIGSRDKVTA